MAVANGQIVLTAAGEEFYERVDWSGDEPVSGRLHEDPVSPIRVNPLVRSGLPAVGGISTEAITGELTAEPLEEVAEDCGAGLPGSSGRLSPYLPDDGAPRCGCRRPVLACSSILADRDLIVSAGQALGLLMRPGRRRRYSSAECGPGRPLPC